SGLTNSVFVVDMMPASRYTHNYQYDGIGSTNSIGVEAAANVFTAQNKNGAASERLDAVTVSFMRDADVNYQIEIYTNLTDPTNPEKGYLHKSAITTGKLTYPGIYTIPLKNSFYLAPGEKFSVVVKSLDGDRWFNCEESHTYPYGVQATAHADKGESFYKGSLELTTWKDVAEDKYPDCGNMCIKALTNDSSAKKYMVTYNLDGGTNDDSNPISFLSTQSGSYTLQNPTRSGYHFLGWYADAACTQQVTTIDYNAKEDKTLYAKWCADNSAPITEVISRATFSTDGSAHVTCSGCGKDLGVQTVYRVDSVKLDSSKPTYTGENVNPVPVIKDSKGNKLVKGEDYTYSYSKSSRKSTGRYYVTVTFKNRYSGSKKLYFTVVPKAPSSASAKLYGYNDVKVSWKKSAGASGYHVYYKKTTSKSYSKYKSTTKLNVKFSNLNGNVKYNFKIVPYYKSGDKKYESTKSKVVSATTLKKLAVPKMKAYSYTRAYLSWECISGASGYQTAWSKSKNGTYKQLCDYGSRYSNINFTVGRGVSYWYKVRAYKTVDGKKIYGPWSEPKQYALK
ncbi:MAG: InlB B-repeat-containing protein, partial [Firmicutes bacterium]|nr:InlB B-repeat-containing protein [Bacillota bacterium]